MIYVIMGVSGAGKTRIGTKLADHLGLPFYDADRYHSPGNIIKMKSGRPLNDTNRRNWLKDLRRHMIAWDKKGDAVLACSALKKSYRQILSSDGVSTQFIYLKGSKSLIAKRMNKRSGHFMPLSLLDSQFEALEEPENAITVAINQSPVKVVEAILSQI